MKKLGLVFGLLVWTVVGFASSPPPASQVFKLSVERLDPNTFLLSWEIKEGFFIYQKSLAVTPTADSNVQLGDLRFPPPIAHYNTQGKKYWVYRKQLVLPVAVLGSVPGESMIRIHYQGCSDDGFCYPPEMKDLKLAINPQLALSDIALEESTHAIEPSQKEPLAQLFFTNSGFMIILSFLGFGLLLALTPCVFPMIPVLSGIIVGHGPNLSARKAFLLSLSYVLSMSVTYAAIGALIASVGSNLQVAMQSAWAIGLFSFLFVLLALSMFGFYDLKLPLSWQNKLATVTRSHEGGHYLSAALMGSLSILILSPCVTAPLIGALSYIAQTGDIFLGTLALFFLGLGMGAPLLLIGTSAGHLLPRAGQWMNAIKSFFGVLLLGMAIYLMARILHPTVIMFLWGCLCIFTGLFAGALRSSRSSLERIGQGIGIILLVYGLLIIVGTSKGNTNPLLPLASFDAIKKNSKETMHVVKTLPEAKKALSKAKGKPVVLDFYADWCASCQILAKTIFQDPPIQTRLKKFVVLKVDLTANNDDSRELLRFFNVIAPPTFLFFTAKGHELEYLRLVGEITAPTFYQHLGEVKPKAQ